MCLNYIFNSSRKGFINLAPTLPDLCYIYIAIPATVLCVHKQLPGCTVGILICGIPAFTQDMLNDNNVENNVATIVLLVSIFNGQGLLSFMYMYINSRY